MKGFSLIVPCYNVENDICRFLHSVFANQYENYELVLVNDGSTDESEVVFSQFFYNKLGGGVGSFRYKYIRVDIASHKYNGVSSARNMGLQYVHNEYIVFADPDDTISPKYFETLNERLSKEDVDILIFGFQKIKMNAAGEEVEKKDRIPHNSYNCVSKEQIIRFYLPNILGYSKEHLANYKKNKCLNLDFEWGAIWRCCYRSELILLNNIKFNTEISLNEDSVFNYWCCVYANTLKSCDDILYHYYMRESGALNQLKKSVRFSNKRRMAEERNSVITVLQQQGYIITEDVVYGSCVLSIIELMIKSKPLDFQKMEEYINIPIVRNSIINAPMTGKSQYDILFTLLKCGLWKPLYFILNIIGDYINI